METDLANVDCFWQLIMAEQVSGKLEITFNTWFLLISLLKYLSDNCIKMFTKVTETDNNDYNDVDMMQPNY